MVQEGEEDLFNGDLNFLMLMDTEVVENVQVWLSTVIDKQMALMVQYASHLLDKVQGVMIKLLEMGETVLKGVTMKVLAKLHEVWCLGTLEMWGEESMWVARVIKLLVFSEELDTLERDVIKDGLMALIKSIMTIGEHEEEMIILSSHILPVWQEVVQAGKMDKLGHDMRHVLSSLVSRGMSVKEVIDEVDSVGLVRMIMDMQEPDMEVIAWSEVEEAGMMECVVGQRGGKRRLEGDLSNNRSMQLVSQAWRTILGHYDGKLHSPGSLLHLCKLLGGMLAKVVRSQFKGELEILDRNTFTQATKSVVNLLCKRGDQVSTVLECLDILVQVDHMWPGCSVWV